MSTTDSEHWDVRYQQRIDEGRFPAPDPLLLQFTPHPEGEPPPRRQLTEPGSSAETVDERGVLTEAAELENQ